MKIKIDNIGMHLYVASMQKLFKAEYVCVEESTHSKLFKNGYIAVGCIPDSNVQVLAKQYGGVKHALKNLSSDKCPYADYYINPYDNNYYQVAKFATSQEQANSFMEEREDVGLICTIEATDETPELYVLASMKKV